MKATEEVCAAYLNQSLEGFDRQLQQVAIACARKSPFDDVLPAASRLIMLPDLEQTDKPAVQLELKTDPGGQEFEHRIKALLRTQNPTQAQLLDLLLGHLHDDLHLTRVALMLLSRDHSNPPDAGGADAAVTRPQQAGHACRQGHRRTLAGPNPGPRYH
jgi:hypothetical protein